MIGISIIICCYNSARRLPDTLLKISELNQDNCIPWEIIVVNNLSTDGTVNVAKTEWEKYRRNGVDFIIVNENTPGLNFARSKGAKLAKFNWLLYCDDDNWLDIDYLSNFKKIIDSNKELKMVCCGISKAIYEKPPKKWFYNYQHLCAVFNINDYGYDYRISKDLSDECDVCGAGMFVQKDLIISYFNDEGYIISDRIGKKLNSGGDTDLVNYFLKKKYMIGQYAKLRIQHFIPVKRTTRFYILCLAEGMTYSSQMLTYKAEAFIQKPNIFILFKNLIKPLFFLNLFRASLSFSHYLGWRRAYNEVKINTQTT